MINEVEILTVLLFVYNINNYTQKYISLSSNLCRLANQYQAFRQRWYFIPEDLYSMALIGYAMIM